METLQKIDPQKHMYRWYSIGIQNTLVDEISVVTGWGSLKSPFQQWRTYQMDSLEAANDFYDKIIAVKLIKGYVKHNK